MTVPGRAGGSYRVLIANRGEIAVRIVRACAELGFESVVVHSDADRDGLAVRLADRSVCIGPADVTRSYRSIGTIVQVALAAGCDAIHPGYGFLAENAEFARAVTEAGLAFVGPSAAAIDTMGDKIAARTAAERLDVPVVPGATLTNVEPREALALAREVGFPVLLKASAGGGGKGIRPVAREEDFDAAFAEATAEAVAVFGSGDLYVERYVGAARHVEVQVFGDGAGGVVVLGERDCSVQRRHQKLIEEAPSPVVSEEVRRGLCEAARALAAGISYAGAGTVEFLYDMDSKEFFFIEMNTRIQVEHPVTEAVHGDDLVAAQLWFAATGEVRVSESPEGLPEIHAIECRINAEDPRTFLPHPGRIAHLELPGGPGVRVDTHCTTGYTITPYYDSMIAKIIAWGPDRDTARARMLRALRELRVDGLSTTADLHAGVLAHPDFIASQHTTTWLETTGLVATPGS
ncbi:acetyl-CoA carboxylase biotin carboxylase subunit [Aeromicrobium sp. YIM 150415]|uniref:acetyl-CoA carboxylase biotin carboxylase subunit n=1 Tax=Aeromicrobium sp. YIM 150415 TaxID=2803912 RepID=UPI0019627EE4|nr:acetyl-CoA carboxylase biotin carboxylase subunit [Aeromicrobium sp. YIM 150415]MBM9463461.1 acetyl-CoA carboxylase biotin carboxylase subunit [Aeromicrobium sp. YIM 150415]